MEIVEFALTTGFQKTAVSRKNEILRFCNRSSHSSSTSFSKIKSFFPPQTRPELKAECAAQRLHSTDFPLKISKDRLIERIRLSISLQSSRIFFKERNSL